MHATDDRLDTLFAALADTTRRLVLRRTAADGAVALDALCEAVAEAEGTTAHRAELSLRHVHLPALDAAGVIAYDAGAGTVRATAALAASDDALAALEDPASGRNVSPERS